MADDGCNSGAFGAHIKTDGHVEQAHVIALGQDKDGVENDVDDRAGALGDHRVERSARRLHQALKNHLAIHAERKAAHHREIIHAEFHDLLVLGLREHERATAKEAEQQKDQKTNHGEENAVFGNTVGALAVARAQRTRQKRVDADRCARRQPDHQVLRGETERYGGKRLFADHADEDAIDDVVQRLNQHRYHHRYRHVQHEFADGHNAHFVFGSVFHGNPFLSSSIVLGLRGHKRRKKRSAPPDETVGAACGILQFYIAS